VVCKKGRKMPNGGVLKKDSIYYMLRLGVNDTKRLGKFMYQEADDCLCLYRKANVFKSLTDIREATYNKRFLPFADAKKYVSKLELKNWAEWKKYSKSGQRPEDIPSLPNITYKKDFKGMKDFLGV